MRRALWLALLAAPIVCPAMAQQPPTAEEPQSTPLPALPSPDVPAGSKPSAYLSAAQVALATGKTGETEQALEQAETRLLDRSVPLFQTNTPAEDPLTQEITKARAALAAHDRMACMQHIQAALAQAKARGL